MRLSVQRGSNPQGCEASRARGEVLCSHQSFIKSAEWRIFLLRYSVQRGSNPQGNIPSSPPQRGKLSPSRHGLSSPLQRMELLTLVPSRNKVPLYGGVARYRAPRKCNFRGWLGRGGLSPEISAKGETRVTSHE